MQTEIRTYQLGENFLGSPHAVSASLPTMQDIIGYEEKEARVHDAMQGGYPRFKRHAFLKQLSKVFLQRHGFSDRFVRFLPDETSALLLRAYLGEGEVMKWEACWAVVYTATEETEKRAHKFLQHTGMALTSREAEDILLSLGKIEECYAEEYEGDFNTSSASLKQQIHEYTAASLENIHLARCGMNAIYALVSAMRQTRPARRWVRIGWMYVDTMHILDEFTGGEPAKHILDVSDFEACRKVIEEQKENLAGVFIEFPTNPLVHAADIQRLFTVCRAAQLPLIVDVSLNGVQTVQPFPYADAVTCSLTKYFGNTCDVLGGTMVFAQDSLITKQEQEKFREALAPLCARSVRRLAYSAKSLATIHEKISANTRALVAYFSSHPLVKKVHWAGAEAYAQNYEQIASLREPGGVFSIELTIPVQKFYDQLALPKGPSFGTFFTMLCPYMYLAHYDGIADPSKLHGINPELLRISVGTEPITQLRAVFERAFAEASPA